MAAPYSVRPVRAHEWRQVRQLRLAALSDEAAPIAFLQTYDDAAARPDGFWRERVEASAVDAGTDATARQFIAVHEDGTWVGGVVALVDAAATPSAGNVVAVHLLPEHRGRGVVQQMLAEATGWLRERGLQEARLHVHADNVRAQRAYAKAGFTRTGTSFTSTIGPEIEMATPL
jgi:ribosomal protein S18 acetylase RimI-like enzyme